jgi:CRISPR/Cas system CSM-associated protein Csm2 small subunit
MADDYPYMVSNNKISQIIEAIHSAAKPPTFSHEFLKKLGFNSSNDRAVIPLFKRLGFLTDSGVPTSHFDDLKDKTKRNKALAQRIRELYAEIYAINTEIHNGTEEEIKGAISRVTGKDATTVGRYYATFKTLTTLADFSVSSQSVIKTDKERGEENEKIDNGKDDINKKRTNSFHYNIQIHLPATTDISVYNAIFKSLRDNLII